MTVDEELGKLEDNIRRLKIEFEAYFNGGMPRPPNDTLYRVEQAIKKHSSDISRLNAGQRFRFNQLVQRYAVYNELWRKKLRNKEEGRETFVRGRGYEEEEQAFEEPVHVVCSDPDRENEKVHQLLDALLEAKRSVGDRTDDINPAQFQKFVRTKTQELKQKMGCESVRFSITVEDGRVKFTAVKAE